MLTWERVNFKSGREEKVSKMLPEQAGKQGQCWLKSGEAVELVLKWEKEKLGYCGIRERATEEQNYLLLSGAWKSKGKGQKENNCKCCRKGGGF